MQHYNNFLKEFNITFIINYLRRSRQDVQREKQTGEDTLSSQQKLMANVLDSYGIPYEQRFEIGSGDKISTRPVFKTVLEDLENGKFNAVAVKEISRLGRGSYGDMETIYNLLRDYKVFVITPNKIYNPLNDDDLRVIRFELFMSREELERTKERLSGARLNSALEGKWMGNVPFGYERNPKTLRLQPIEEEADIVKLIYNLYIYGFEGKTVKEKAISTILKTLGKKTAKGEKIWDTTQLRRVLTNDAYIGVSKFRTTKRNSQGKIEARPKSEHIIVNDAHKEIISKEDFEKVQEIMKNKKVPRTRFDVDARELTGLFRCSVCGKKAVINAHNRKRRSGTSYLDRYVRCRNTCFTTKYEKAEEAIEILLKELKDADENTILEMYQKSIIKEEEIKQEEIKEQVIESLTKRKEDLEKRLKFIQEKHFNGIYTDEDFLKFKKELDEEKREIELMEQNNAFNESAVTKEGLDAEEIKKKFIKVIDVYKSEASAENKNELLRSIFENINITILESGTKKKAPKIKLDVVLTTEFWK